MSCSFLVHWKEIKCGNESHKIGLFKRRHVFRYVKVLLRALALRMQELLSSDLARGAQIIRLSSPGWRTCRPGICPELVSCRGECKPFRLVRDLSEEGILCRQMCTWLSHPVVSTPMGGFFHSWGPVVFLYVVVWRLSRSWPKQCIGQRKIGRSATCSWFWAPE